MYSENELASKVVDVCFKIHTMYGPASLKVSTRKYSVMNGIKIPFHL